MWDAPSCNMCGLWGWISFERALSDADVGAARRATGLLAHRGPDYQGEWVSQRVYMGHRRLNIIDLSAAANQPMQDATGRYRFIFNGEIYNYLELRDELQQAGVTFRTRSDSEVFLSALIRWGTAALTRVDGMFAAALHDQQTGEHLLMRDPLGQKPLYYAVGPEGVLYASELRSLLAMADRKWTIDRDAFLRFLLLGYYSRSESPVVGARKLLPGHVMRITGASAAIERYWDSLPGQPADNVSEHDALDSVDRLLGESCARSLRADVPYGVLLSGGLDSTLIASYCRRSNPDLRAISVAMGEQDFDESDKAAMVCSHLKIGSAHRVTMNEASVVGALRDMFTTSDEPHADPGFVNARFLASAARQHMVVALAGDGGDELFAGYPPFAGLGIEPALRYWPGSLVKAARTAACLLLPSSDRYLGLQFKARAFLQGFPATPALRIPWWLSSVGADDAARIAPARGASFFSTRGGNGSVFDDAAQLLSPMDRAEATDRLLYYYQKVFLPEFVCMHTDRAAMQFGLEVRAPFLSLPLVDAVNRFPSRLKHRGGELKVLLRRLAARHGLPEAIVRQRKQGFTFPIARWLKSTLRGELDGLARSPEFDGLGLDARVLQEHVDDHLAGRRNNYRLLYHLIVFRAWRRQYPHLGVA